MYYMYVHVLRCMCSYVIGVVVSLSDARASWGHEPLSRGDTSVLLYRHIVSLQIFHQRHQPDLLLGFTKQLFNWKYFSQVCAACVHE